MKNIFKMNFRQLQNEINRRESIKNGLCAECWYKGQASCDCKNDVEWGKLRYVATQDLYQMRLQFRESNNPNDEGYATIVAYPEDNKIITQIDLSKIDNILKDNNGLEEDDTS